MDWRRALRHLWIGAWHVRKKFPPGGLQRITEAIGRGESAHHGEIRFAVEASLDWPYLWKGISARERAVEVFSQLRIWDTEANNGVLIYLLLADRDVEIIADRGIHAKVGAEGWEDICRKMEADFRRGEFEKGVLAGIQTVGAHLERHFPRRGDDVNELPDTPVIL